MAVPSSGTITLLGIAQERYYGTYGTGTITGPIVYQDLINGGNAGGSGMTYPALNTSSASLPTTTTPWPMNEWYSYDQNATSCTSVLLGYGSTRLTACNTIGSGNTYFTSFPSAIHSNPLYANSACSSHASAGNYAILGGGGTVGYYNGSGTWSSISTCRK